jgi:hypothetical protein
VVQQSASNELWCKQTAVHLDGCVGIRMYNRITCTTASTSGTGGVMKFSSPGRFETYVERFVPDIGYARHKERKINGIQWFYNS